MALMSYIIRDRHRTYYFRRVIPATLRGFMPEPWTGKANWKKSLGTKDGRVARREAAKLLAACEADFEAAERAMQGKPPAEPPPLPQPTMPAPEQIEADEIARLLAEDEAERSDGDARRQLQTEAERAYWPDLTQVKTIERHMEEDHFLSYGEQLQELASEYRKAAARSDVRIVHAEVRGYLRAKGLPIVAHSQEYHQTALAVLRAHAKAHDLMLRRQEGEVIPTPPPSANRGPKLSEAYAAWKAGSGARGTKKPSARTLLEADRAVRQLTEFHGDLLLGDLTREKVRDFRNALEKVPKNLPTALRQMPIRDLIEQDLKDYPPAHASTINKHLTLLGAIVSHAEAAGSLDEVQGFRNPFGKGMKLPVDAREAEEREAFDDIDLAAIFGTGVFSRGERPVGGGGEAAYWLPLIALLSGARQGEMAQLRVMDLKKDAATGIWYFDIGTSGGRKVKTVSSKRKVPLHPALERIGLLRYREALMAAGAGPAAPFWPRVEADQEGRPAGPWSKWFNRYLRDKAGIEDRTKVFHSFRHTFKQLARSAKIGEEMHDALTGHAGNGSVGRGYGKFELEALAEGVGQIREPAALRQLSWEPVVSAGSARPRVKPEPV